jgi:multimeric flavodoxin WrbA
MQYVRFLELAFPSHTFVIEDVGQRIVSIESHDEDYSRVIASVESADAVLFATPVYFMLVPSQLKRFIELVFTRNSAGAFSKKYAASLTTSIYFFDHTANAYLHAIGEDLGMSWAGSFSAKMDDLLDEKNQKDLILFAEDFFATVTGKTGIQPSFPPIAGDIPQYRPGPVPLPFDAKGKSVVILSDAAPGSNLEKMVTRAASCFGRAASIVSLDDADMKGGCLGCCRCAFDNRCVYTDGFSRFFEDTILSADIIIFAGPIRDRYLSWKFKQFLDRSFYRGHVSCMAGKQFGVLIEGPLSQCCTLREILSAYPAMQGANPAGIVTDEGSPSEVTDARIEALCEHILRLSESGYIAPAGFPAAAGHKIFRDEIWAEMRAFFRADDSYFRRHGLYDFPQYDPARRIRTTFLSLLFSIPSVRKKAMQQMNRYMIQPFSQVLEKSPVLKERAGRN